MFFSVTVSCPCLSANFYFSAVLSIFFLLLCDIQASGSGHDFCKGEIIFTMDNLSAATGKSVTHFISILLLLYSYPEDSLMQIVA